MAANSQGLEDAGWLAEQSATRSASSIARELGVAPGTVLRALRLHGIPIRSGTALRRATRRPELDDAEWLTEHYSRMSAEAIAAELGVAPSTVLRALRMHGIAVRGVRDKQKFRTPAVLDDADWLRQEYTSKSGAQIAAELGVSIPGVHKAMRRLGVEADGPWVRRDTTRLEAPSSTRLEQAWLTNESIKGVARTFGVSVPTAAVWLADIGIFRNPEPVISRSQLLAAIESGKSIEEIASDHRVGDLTVRVELRRHGLVEQHRRRRTS